METLLLLTGIYSSIVLILVTIVFFVSQLIEDNSIMDICYGPIFAIATWSTGILTGSFTTLSLIIATIVTLWAIRLSFRIGKRNWGKPEDPRYATWRTSWHAKGRTYFILRSLVQINLLQGLVICIVSLPLIISMSTTYIIPLPLLIIGVLVSIGGLCIEILADYQLDTFIAKKRAGNTDEVLLTHGLFAYSRHPNYVGETLVWWGLSILVIAVPFGYIALLSPLTITYIVVFVTGPMLETQMLRAYPDEFSAYQKQTNYFLPKRTKRASSDL